MNGRKQSAASSGTERIPAVVIHAEWPPKEDNGATQKIREWARWARRELRRSGKFSVTALLGRTITHRKVTAALEPLRGRFGLVMFYGHGCACGGALLESKRRRTGKLFAAVAESDCVLLENKIVYAVACHSAKALGKRAIEQGAHCYIGYDDWLIFTYEGVISADAIGACVNAGIEELMGPRAAVCPRRQGRAAGRRIREKYESLKRRLLRRGMPLAAFFLEHNLDALSY